MITVIVVASVVLGVSFSWAQGSKPFTSGKTGSMISSVNASPTGTGSPWLGYGLSVSGTNATASAEMIAVRQDWDGSDTLTTTRYHERVGASGDIDKFN
ncbi:MAG: hypothetical protein SWE60_22180, partial [Thermodesulfobacteriota bacterium]|nr:hypothetical protein [Thermodesulfobacteriota bacterium]